jgi:hypothetical protein
MSHFFAMEVIDPKQIADACKNGNIPTPKIDLLCDIQDQMTKLGEDSVYYIRRRENMRLS